VIRSVRALTKSAPPLKLRARRQYANTRGHGDAG
jgi:hypothetical protein